MALRTENLVKRYKSRVVVDNLSLLHFHGNIADNHPALMALRTENLVKRYKSRVVVGNVSVEVKQGEIVGLLGPNGAGKTTTFYMTVGLIKPNEGKIFLNDKDITREPMYKRAQLGIGYLPQEASG